MTAGCASLPAFDAALPTFVDTTDKTIAVIGDLQQTAAFVRFIRRRENNDRQQKMLIDDLSKYIDQLAALIIVGDLVYSARSRSDWRHFDTLVAPFAAHMPILPAIGNHDYPCFLIQWCRTGKMARGMRARFPWMEPGQPFSVDTGRLLLLFLDSESEFESQGRWLKDRLADAAGRFSAALVFFHRPAWSNSIDRGATGSAEVRQFIVPALNAAALPIVVFNGHVHGFEYRVRNGVHYVTTAGGGGPRGPMPAGPTPDDYQGDTCVRTRDGAILRPYNYVLLRERADKLEIEVRGFCRGDTEVRSLDRIEVDL
jgi:hypothetical protein